MPDLVFVDLLPICMTYCKCVFNNFVGPFKCIDFELIILNNHLQLFKSI